MGSYLLVLLAGLATAHEYFPEKCPSFTPMQGFDWEQVGFFSKSFRSYFIIISSFTYIDLVVIFSLRMVCGTSPRSLPPSRPASPTSSPPTSSGSRRSPRSDTWERLLLLTSSFSAETAALQWEGGPGPRVQVRKTFSTWQFSAETLCFVLLKIFWLIDISLMVFYFAGIPGSCMLPTKISPQRWTSAFPSVRSSSSSPWSSSRWIRSSSSSSSSRPNRSGKLCGVGHWLHELRPHLHVPGDRPLHYHGRLDEDKKCHKAPDSEIWWKHVGNNKCDEAIWLKPVSGPP